jgi:hypothetical protein
VTRVPCAWRMETLGARIDFFSAVRPRPVDFCLKSNGSTLFGPFGQHANERRVFIDKLWAAVNGRVTHASAFAYLPLTGRFWTFRSTRWGLVGSRCIIGADSDSV